jgi:cytochrome oxidase Cu insertion factor (SCO1/SenC/PrrC family)
MSKPFVVGVALLAACTGPSAPAAHPAAPAPPAAAAAPASPASPSLGKAADFTLNDSDGHPVALHDLLQQGPVILAFFPKAFTGG